MFGSNALQNDVDLLWDGAANEVRYIGGWNRRSIVFKVRADLAADATFCIGYYMADAATPCEHDPESEEVAQVKDPCYGLEYEKGVITIPAGTTAGSTCSATIDCPAGPYMTLLNAENAADIHGFLLLSGPH